MDCFYALPGDISSSNIILRGDEARHLARVLRRAVGERVFVTDGQDRMFEMEITAIGPLQTVGVIVAEMPRLHESPLDVTIGVSLLRNPSRFDYLVEKATEIGVRRIVPLICDRTIPRSAKVDRYRHLALAAMKQSCRCYLPVIDPPMHLPEFLAGAGPDALRVLPHEQAPEDLTIGRLLRTRGGVPRAYLAIGPEGGFSDEEVSAATQATWELVRMGSRRLRAETAALVALTLLLHSAP